MINFKNIGLSIIFSMMIIPLFSHINPDRKRGKVNVDTSTEINFREDCTAATAQVDMDINNVRARLLTGGDVWWDLQDGKYVVPAPPVGSGIPEVSSIFAGAVWLGGRDPSGNLKVAATDYRNGGQTDFYPGPLDPVTGLTDLVFCQRWDQFFQVDGTEADKAIRDYEQAVFDGVEYEPDSIPAGVKYWPGKGNPYFNEEYGFDLPDTGQGLGSFWDEDLDGEYDPVFGDFPIIDIRGCEPENRKQAKELVPDQMMFWIYNDAGGPHSLTQGTEIQMEVQVQAFAYATNDEINDMTFQRYKLINRAETDIRNTYFAMWVDPDLGCHLDDYSGCDIERSLAYTYNEDGLDGNNGCNCDGGVNTYCDEVPIIGTDYFRGPLGPKNFLIIGGDTILENPALGETDFDTIVELGMSSFIYYNNGGIGQNPQQTNDPSIADEFYNYLQGSWRDGTPLTIGGSGFNPGSVDTTRFAFFDPPNDPTGWSMAAEALAFGDRRTLQASGPFLLKPGAINELIIGAVWVPNVMHPNPDISKLQAADDIAQNLFDACFDIIDGPDAPDVDIIELDREIILVLSNDTILSNNAFEAYSELDILSSDNIPEEDRTYLFEGYKIYQLQNANVSPQELDEVEKARLVAQVDVKNGVAEIFNWSSVPDPNPAASDPIWTFDRKVDGADEGVDHTFRLLTDQFADGDNRLVNHRKYYYMAVAYAYNNYATFEPGNPTLTQQRPYLEGRGNIKTYTAIPRPIVYTGVNAAYGDGAAVTRLSGVGVGGNLLDMDDEMYDKILDGSFDGAIDYKSGAGPINIKIYNPLEVKDGTFQLEMIGNHRGGSVCALDPGVVWELTDVNTGYTLASEQTIDALNEQLVAEYGFSVAIGQTADAGTGIDDNNGALAAFLEYSDPEGDQWFGAMRDNASGYGIGFNSTVFNFLKTSSGEIDETMDQNQSYSSLGDGYFYPFILASAEPADASDVFSYYITPAWKVSNSHEFLRDGGKNGVFNLNNVDIIFTSDKDKWSRCIVVETANEDYLSFRPTTGDADMFDLRQSPSVDKNGQDIGDGTVGYSWFPGYAVDVETGRRLNIFFGENSVFNAGLASRLPGIPEIGDDMVFNPNDQLFRVEDNLVAPGASPEEFVLGGNHFIYVTRQDYDGCEDMHNKLNSSNNLFGKIDVGKAITWASMVLLPDGQSMLPYDQGAVPNDLTIKLRVENPYNLETSFNIQSPNSCQTVGDLPKYEFTISGKETNELEEDEYEGALANVNVVPNPYYAYSSYETSQFSKTVKITNLPARATITIYSLDGKFIKQFIRDERVVQTQGANRGVNNRQILPDVEWDIENSAGIPIASGVYLIHVVAPDLGEERTLKWFGINRKFDPSGL
ncbi:MAG: hypothetical protein KJO29_11095 [Bacteroidia bacterium]|nr:hypothetical protein [Bacteroidia bacterium]